MLASGGTAAKEIRVHAIHSLKRRFRPGSLKATPEIGSFNAQKKTRREWFPAGEISFGAADNSPAAFATALCRKGAASSVYSR
jgi:hypothetical protein